MLADENPTYSVAHDDPDPVSLAAPKELTKILLPPSLKTADQNEDPTPPLTVTNIKSEDFEGTSPNDWLLFDNNGATGGDVLWAADSHEVNAGSFSGWPVGGGADGVPGSSNYPNDADSWMVYGPFDLSDASSATMDFSLWMNTKANFDYINWLASSDGESFSGYEW